MRYLARWAFSTQKFHLNRKGRKARKEIPISKGTAGDETWPGRSILAQRCWAPAVES